MARRRRASTGTGEWLRPMAGLALLGLLFLAVRFGLVEAGSARLMEMLRPGGPTNAGELYREQIEHGEGHLGNR